MGKSKKHLQGQRYSCYGRNGLKGQAVKQGCQGGNAATTRSSGSGELAKRAKGGRRAVGKMSVCCGQGRYISSQSIVEHRYRCGDCRVNQEGESTMRSCCPHRQLRPIRELCDQSRVSDRYVTSGEYPARTLKPLELKRLRSDTSPDASDATARDQSCSPGLTSTSESFCS